MSEKQHEWYQTWFDTPYYHILYQDRGHEEAKRFMKNLTNYLQLKRGDKILDLACGRGRHSLFLGSLGFKVTGADLSENSITYAAQFETPSVQFVVHDMCQPYPKQFHAIFNLFTSFGYFETKEDNERAIQSIKESLLPGGFGVIDFMNTDYVIPNLIKDEVKVVDKIRFTLKRYVKDGFLFKEISFSDQGHSYHFTERVKIITLGMFKAYFKRRNMKLFETFGDYELHPFDSSKSPRLILIFR